VKSKSRTYFNGAPWVNGNGLNKKWSNWEYENKAAGDMETPDDEGISKVMASSGLSMGRTKVSLPYGQA